jgi:hypothetical protein
MTLDYGSAEGLVVVRLLRFFAAIPLASRVVHAADFSVSRRNRVTRLLKEYDQIALNRTESHQI